MKELYNVRLNCVDKYFLSEPEPLLQHVYAVYACDKHCMFVKIMWYETYVLLYGQFI